MCDHRFWNSGYSNICHKCGIESYRWDTEIVSGYTSCQPLWIGYNRSNRFRKMVLALCKPLIHSKIPGKMYLHLQKYSKCENMDELYVNMKSAICSDKGYNGMHLYAIKYLKKYSPLRSPSKKVIRDLVSDFVLVERGHKLHFSEKHFFSYRWILIALLKYNRLFAWVDYVKPLKNKSSNRRYQKMFDFIMTANMRVPIRDTVAGIGKPLGQQRDGGSQSRSQMSFGLNHEESGPHLQAVWSA